MTHLSELTRSLAWIAGELDPLLIRRVAIWLVASLVVAGIRPLRGRVGLAAVGALACVGLYGSALPGFILTNLVVFGHALLLTSLSARRRWPVALAGVVALAAVFVIGRHLGLEGRATTVVSGYPLQLYYCDMWLVLRLVTYLWETGAGRIQVTPLGFAVWSLLPFTAAGPVIRYTELEPQLSGGTGPGVGAGSEGRLQRLCSRAALMRLLGAGLAIYAAAALMVVHRAVVETGELHVPWLARLLIAFNAPPWAFYLGFAGSVRIAEVLATGWGITLPLSFDRPFFRADLGEFWANWNATATRVFRDYLFFNRWGFARSNMYVNSFLVFLICGLWHGSNAYWLTWGALHGVGFGLHLFLTLRRRGRTRAAGQEPAAARGLVTWAGTYLFVLGCWMAPPQLLAAWRWLTG